MIKEKILEMNFKDFNVEIETVDVQESLDGGVVLLVTGSLAGRDMVKGFVQSFVLAHEGSAPQKNAYFVLNDIFKYVDEENHQLMNVGLLGELLSHVHLNEV